MNWICALPCWQLILDYPALLPHVYHFKRSCPESRTPLDQLGAMICTSSRLSHHTTHNGIKTLEDANKRNPTITAPSDWDKSSTGTSTTVLVCSIHRRVLHIDSWVILRRPQSFEACLEMRGFILVPQSKQGARIHASFFVHMYFTTTLRKQVNAAFYMILRIARLSTICNICMMEDCDSSACTHNLVHEDGVLKQVWKSEVSFKFMAAVQLVKSHMKKANNAVAKEVFMMLPATATPTS